MNKSLPGDRLENTEAWGGASSALEYVYRPSTRAEIREILDLASRRGIQVGLRGAGYSYGDAPLNAERIVLDCSRMNRILEWDPDNGIISAEPGVSISRLWRYCLGDGWWPPVVPGTMFPTLGGCLGSNVHGKNNWHAGTLGDNTLEFEALLPSGEQITCRPDHNSDLFYAMIGGFGSLGVITRITLRMQQIASGNLRVRSLTEPNIQAMVARMEQLKGGSEYLVGWVDGIARGRSLGRGQIHTADYFEHGEDPQAVQSLRLDYQDLPETFFGLIPKSIMWLLMRPFMNKLGVPFINRGRYWSARLAGDHEFIQSLAEFNFLLDYIPNWKRAYQPLGLVQFQTFLAANKAADGIAELLRLSQQRGLPAYLAVLKRHRSDDFLLSHALDGFSIAMDFRVTRRNRAAIAQLLQELEQSALSYGGRFYLAKDSSLEPQSARQFLGEAALTQLQALKLRCDPENVLSTNLLRRVFPEVLAGSKSALAAHEQLRASKVN